MVIAIGVFEASTNIFLPSLPSIQAFFGAQPSHVQLTVSLYLLGFALLGLIGGPLSDSIGRRPVLLFGLTLFLIGSALCYFHADRSLPILIAARFLQGLGAGLSTILIMVVIKDLYNEVQCARILSIMGMMIAIAPMIAPMVGGAIADFYAWQTNFLIMLVAATIVFFMYLRDGKESSHKRTPFHISKILHRYRDLLKNKKSLQYCCVSMFVYGALFAWLVHAPFYFELTYNITGFSYAAFAAIGPITYIFGSFLNYIFLPRFGMTTLIRAGLYTAMAGAFFLLLNVFIGPYFWTYFIGFLIFNGGMAPVFANASTRALEFSDDHKGAASALLASLEQSFAAFATFVVGYGAPTSIILPVAFMVISLLASYAVFRNLSKRDA